MRIIELVIEEEDDSLFAGIDAISIVEYPAIEENFVALNKQKEYKLAEVDADKKLLTGALLVPNKMIYRKDGDDEYYIHFSKETVRKASEMFLIYGNQNNSTFEHRFELSGLSLVESWIVEDEVKDKSQVYDMDLPIGTWVGTMKVNNDEVWDEYVKSGKVKGFSIEGYFVEKSKREELKKEVEAGLELLKIKEMILEQEMRLESYNDYPQSATNNAKRALKWVEKNGWGSCGEATGKKRANQIANREPLSRDTISRMASFKRHQQHKDVPYSEGCGGLMWDAWGGTSGVEWAINKLKQIDKK